ncbi:MAG: sel1 repeat family protein [Deltaproteobacteria bacterium]|jgi:TPR repeat protein|nr:sel1 repeat family protein [Deltaproteobacteria bacterium]
MRTHDMTAVKKAHSRTIAPAVVLSVLTLLSAALCPQLMAQSKGGAVTPDFVKTLESQAAGGDVAAVHTLGTLYFYGEGVPQSYAKSLPYFQSAAESGFPPSMSFLGYLYEKGYGVAKDPKKAADLYEKAANQGDTLAQLSLGAMYLHGESIAPDYKMAMTWLTKASKSGDYQADLLLGQMYVEGKGTDVNPQMALASFKKAADNKEDDGLAAYVTAELYRQGGGNLKPNPKEAKRYYELGAKKGNQQCKARLAELDKK